MGVGAGRAAGVAARAGAGADFSGFLFFSSGLEAAGLAALGLTGFAAAVFEDFGAMLRRNDFVAMQPPDTRGGI
jgi:hypothetical protein